MNFNFPLEVDFSDVSQYDFSTWRNTMNVYEQLQIQLELPSILHLYRADTICPAPNVPFVDLGYFKDKNGKIEVIIQSSVIQHELSLEDYYTYFSLNSKEKIINKRLIDNNPDKADLLTIKKFEDGQSWVTRRTGFKIWMGEGALVITLNFACEANTYNDYADMFFYMMNSFKLINEPEYDLAEKLRLYSRRYPLDFATYIPFSWKEDSHRIDMPDNMQSTFKKQFRGIVSGILHINAQKINNENSSRDALLSNYLAPCIKQGLNLQEVEFTSEKSFFGFTEIEKCDHDFFIDENGTKIGMNVKIYLMKRKKCWFYIGIIGLSESQNFEVWAINKRAFYFAIDELKTK